MPRTVPVKPISFFSLSAFAPATGLEVAPHQIFRRGRAGRLPVSVVLREACIMVHTAVINVICARISRFFEPTLRRLATEKMPFIWPAWKTASPASKTYSCARCQPSFFSSLNPGFISGSGATKSLLPQVHCSLCRHPPHIDCLAEQKVLTHIRQLSLNHPFWNAKRYRGNPNVERGDRLLVFYAFPPTLSFPPFSVFRCVWPAARGQRIGSELLLFI